MAQVIQPNVVMKPADLYREATNQAMDAYKSLSTVMQARKQIELQEKQFDWNKRLQSFEAVYNGLLVPLANRAPGGMQGLIREMGSQFVPLFELMGFSPEAAKTLIEKAGQLPPGKDEIIEYMMSNALANKASAIGGGMSEREADLGVMKGLLDFDPLKYGAVEGARPDATAAEAATPPQPPAREVDSRGVPKPDTRYPGVDIAEPRTQEVRPFEPIKETRPAAQAEKQTSRLSDAVRSLERLERIAMTPVGAAALTREAPKALKEMEVFWSNQVVDPSVIRAAASHFNPNEMKDWIEGTPGQTRRAEMQHVMNLEMLQTQQQFDAAVKTADGNLRLYEMMENMGLSREHLQLAQAQFDHLKDLDWSKLSLEEKKYELAKYTSSLDYLWQVRLMELDLLSQELQLRGGPDAAIESLKAITPLLNSLTTAAKENKITQEQFNELYGRALRVTEPLLGEISAWAYTSRSGKVGREGIRIGGLEEILGKRPKAGGYTAGEVPGPEVPQRQGPAPIGQINLRGQVPANTPQAPQQQATPQQSQNQILMNELLRMYGPPPGGR